MEDEKTCQCGMPLDEKSKCKCNEDVCIYCCECPEDCQCDCVKKQDKDEEKNTADVVAEEPTD